MSDSGFDLGLDDASRSGVYEVHNAHLPSLAAAARDAGLLVRRIDLHGCADRHVLLMRLAAVLELPSGHGRNWDALSDALRDLSWLPASGYALLFESVDTLQAQRPHELGTLLDILQDAAQWWLEDGTPFWAFMGTDDSADAASPD